MSAFISSTNNETASNLMRKSILATAVLAAAFSSAANAEYLYGFGSFGVNYLNWTDKTEDRADKEDFLFLELEGGAGFSWGEVYGFFDLENPQKNNDETDGNGRRTAMKGTLRYYLGETGFNIYAHLYDFNASGFTEQNRLLGIGYNFQNANMYFKPFIAVNNTDKTGFSGFNGYVFGWVTGYNFDLFQQSFALTNWNEYEFDRDVAYGNGDKEGWNGALALWWNAPYNVTLGLQYRYADDKLGSATYQDGFVYTVKYNF